MTPTKAETREGVLYVTLFGAAHAWLTFDMATTRLQAGAICAAGCILIWLLMWFFVRQELRRQPEPERRRWSAELWQTALPKAFPRDWLAPEPEPDAYPDVRKAIRDLARNRRRNRDADHAIDRKNDLQHAIETLQLAQGAEPITFNLIPTITLIGADHAAKHP